MVVEQFPYSFPLVMDLQLWPRHSPAPLSLERFLILALSSLFPPHPKVEQTYTNAI